MKSEKSDKLNVNDIHSLHYAAYAKLGPFCPKCGSLATEFGMCRNPLRGMFEGRVFCGNNCREESRLVYDGNKWVWDKQ